MKTAKQWIAKRQSGNPELYHASDYITAIQCDALRHAAQIARNHNGSPLMAAGWIEREAEYLEWKSLTTQI